MDTRRARRPRNNCFLAALAGCLSVHPRVQANKPGAGWACQGWRRNRIQCAKFPLPSFPFFFPFRLIESLPSSARVSFRPSLRRLIFEFYISYGLSMSTGTITLALARAHPRRFSVPQPVLTLDRLSGWPRRVICACLLAMILHFHPDTMLDCKQLQGAHLVVARQSCARGSVRNCRRNHARGRATLRSQASAHARAG